MPADLGQGGSGGGPGADGTGRNRDASATYPTVRSAARPALPKQARMGEHERALFAAELTRDLGIPEHAAKERALIADAHPTGRASGSLAGSGPRVRVHATITLVGDLDLATSPLVVEAVGRVTAPGVAVTVELAEVGFCDLSGARALIEAAAQAAAAGATLAVAHPPRSLHRVLTAVDLPPLAVTADRTCPTDPGHPGS